MGKKIIILAIFFTTGIVWLSYSGFVNIPLKTEISINNPHSDRQNFHKKTNENKTIKPLSKIKDSISNGIFNTAIENTDKNPNDQEKQLKQSTGIKIENNASNTAVKIALENYFSALSKVNLPESKLIFEAVALHLQGENQGLKIIISILKEKSGEINKLIPPREAENIHKNNLLAVNKSTDILETILEKTGNQKEFDELLPTLEHEIEKTQKIISETNQEIMSLIAKHNLDDGFLR